MKRGGLTILLVEDDDNDMFFVRRATESTGAGHALHGVHNGEEAIHYLRGEEGFSDRKKFPLPNVILTDLKMPQMDGFDFLDWLRSNPQYAVIPVIVYSSSHLEQDIRKAYSLGANSYITKPTSISEMAEILKVICEYWSRCECPPMLTIKGSP